MAVEANTDSTVSGDPLFTPAFIAEVEKKQQEAVCQYRQKATEEQHRLARLQGHPPRKRRNELLYILGFLLSWFVMMITMLITIAGCHYIWFGGNEGKAITSADYIITAGAAGLVILALWGMSTFMVKGMTAEQHNYQATTEQYFTPEQLGYLAAAEAVLGEVLNKAGKKDQRNLAHVSEARRWLNKIL